MNPSFGTDFPFIITWWAVIFVIGAAAFPLTRKLFSSWWDQGYLLSKAVGLCLVTLVVWQLSTFKVLPFSTLSIVVGIVIVFFLGIIPVAFTSKKETLSWKKIIILELFFFLSLTFWSFIKAHEPDIRSLEKFMDYGFSKSIQNTPYFPPPDMWYAGGTINYYYFGHLTQALLSTLSGIHLSYGYNLMLATIFAYCLTMSFGIGVQLYVTSRKQLSSFQKFTKKDKVLAIITGILAAYLVTLAGNMQTIYAFTKGYTGEDPPPFWSVLWTPDEFLVKGREGIQGYWYANATRFIPFTIHEFPSYSFVVSDNHGHVLNIPFALLAISSLLTIFVIQTKKDVSMVHAQSFSLKKFIHTHLPYGLYGGLVGILLMTNALDGPIYLGLFGILLLFERSTRTFLSSGWMKEKAMRVGVTIVFFLVVCAPFLFTFNSFASGLGINCPPSFLANSKIGPFIFEEVEKCQRSPFWMMSLLWGFFWFCGITLTIYELKRISIKHISNSFVNSVRKWWESVSQLHQVLILLFVSTVGLILFSEVFYFKDIYPAHFRSNTMFKLGYQAFMISSLICAYVIVQIVRKRTLNKRDTLLRRIFFLLLIPQLFLVVIFPFFSVRSYFGSLEIYRGLNGLTWFERDYPDDYNAMKWLETRNHIEKRTNNNWLMPLSQVDTHVNYNFFTKHIQDIPVVLEADGDSYTDYNRISVFSGFPTVIGWGVHEWLWRGSYDVVAPRKDHVREIYETADYFRLRELLNKYNIEYVVIGKLERQKFPIIDESRFSLFGQIVYTSGQTTVYHIDK